jgi:hypothetical protein
MQFYSILSKLKLHIRQRQKYTVWIECSTLDCITLLNINWKNCIFYNDARINNVIHSDNYQDCISNSTVFPLQCTHFYQHPMDVIWETSMSWIISLRLNDPTDKRENHILNNVAQDDNQQCLHLLDLLFKPFLQVLVTPDKLVENLGIGWEN